MGYYNEPSMMTAWKGNVAMNMMDAAGKLGLEIRTRNAPHDQGKHGE